MMVVIVLLSTKIWRPFRRKPWLWSLGSAGLMTATSKAGSAVRAICFAVWAARGSSRARNSVARRRAGIAGAPGRLDEPAGFLFARFVRERNRIAAGRVAVRNGVRRRRDR